MLSNNIYVFGSNTTVPGIVVGSGSGVNYQSSCVYGPNFESRWFKPARWCHRQWRNLTSPIGLDRYVLVEILKRILSAAALIIATSAAYLIALPGFFIFTTTSTSSSTLGTTITGSGQSASHRVDLNGTTLKTLNLQSPGKLTITFTEQEQYIEITADDNLYEYLVPELNNQNLILRIRGTTGLSIRIPITYHLHVPHHTLNNFVASGIGAIVINEPKTNKLSCKISGQATVDINRGSTDLQTVKISGQGRYNASTFCAKQSEITIFGQGQASVHASNLLKVSLCGLSRCTYSGRPIQIQRTLFDQGELTEAYS